MVTASRFRAPYVDSNPSSAADCSPDDQRVDVGCGTADGRADFEDKDGCEKHRLAIELGVELSLPTTRLVSQNLAWPGHEHEYTT